MFQKIKINKKKLINLLKKYVKKILHLIQRKKKYYQMKEKQLIIIKLKK